MLFTSDYLLQRGTDNELTETARRVRGWKRANIYYFVGLIWALSVVWTVFFHFPSCQLLHSVCLKFFYVQFFEYLWSHVTRPVHRPSSSLLFSFPDYSWSTAWLIWLLAYFPFFRSIKLKKKSPLGFTVVWQSRMLYRSVFNDQLHHQRKITLHKNVSDVKTETSLVYFGRPEVSTFKVIWSPYSAHVLWLFVCFQVGTIPCSAWYFSTVRVFCLTWNFLLLAILRIVTSKIPLSVTLRYVAYFLRRCSRPLINNQSHDRTPCANICYSFTSTVWIILSALKSSTAEIKPRDKTVEESTWQYYLEMYYP